MHRVDLGALLLSSVMALASCGGRSSDATGADGLAACGASEACGGDLQGTWNVEQYCIGDLGLDDLVGGSGLPSECDGALESAVRGAEIQPVDMQVTFDGMTYAFSGAARLSYTFVYTSACFEALSEGVSLTASTCAQISDNFETDPDYNGTCTYAGSTCRCSIVSTTDFGSSGTYTVRGPELEVDGAGVTAPFCVSGSTATVDFDDGDNTLRMTLRRP